MSQFRLFRSLVAGVLLALVPVAGAANAQVSTQSAAPAAAPAAICVGGPRALTKQENSMVNDFEILVARANSKHTTPPLPSPDVAALIACTSGGVVPPTPAPAPATPSSSSSASPAVTATCVGGPRKLTKQENSMVNDYEILVARANSKHTAPPPVSPDVAALIACS